METSTYLETIRNYIANDDLPAALKQLHTLLENSPKLDEVILQSGRFNDIKRQIRLGTASHAELAVTQNQIRAGLLDLLQEIEVQSVQEPALRQEIERAISMENDINVLIGSTISAGGDVVIGDSTTFTESKTRRRLSVFLYFFVPILALACAYWWWRYQEMQRPLSLKIRLENQTPNAELPEPAGVLSFTFGTKTETKLIANGEALFEGIPSNFNTERVHLQWNAQGFRKVDTSFLLNQEIMVLPVSRNDDLAEIYGIVMNEKGKPLKAVKIAIPCCYALTVATGEFALQIPFDHQKIEQRLDVFKVGYAPKSITTPVIPGEIVRLVLNKQ